MKISVYVNLFIVTEWKDASKVYKTMKIYDGSFDQNVMDEVKKIHHQAKLV